jgi:hypothetical protein
MGAVLREFSFVSSAPRGSVPLYWCGRTFDVAERRLVSTRIYVGAVRVKIHDSASAKFGICRFIELKQITQVDTSWLCWPDQSTVENFLNSY